MQKLKTIIIIYSTDYGKDSGSMAHFELIIAKHGSDVRKDFVHQFGTGFDMAPGEMKEWKFDVSRDNVDADAPEFDISIRMGDSADGWLPSSLYVIGVPDSGARCLLLGCHPRWTGGAFDTNAKPGSNAAREHVVSNYAHPEQMLMPFDDKPSRRVIEKKGTIK